MRRVLRPDGIVGMSEPGRGHANSASTIAEAATGVLENELSLEDVADSALRAGFRGARVIVASDSPLMEVDAMKLRAFMGGRGFARYWRNLRTALDSHHYVLLFAGDPEPTTQRPRRLHASIARVGTTTPLRAKPDERIELRFDLYNSGDSRWLHSSDQRPGWTRFGGHLYRENQTRTLIDFDWLRVALPGDVMPESIQVVAQLPRVHESGRYVIALDLVVEGVTWFADRGSIPLTIQYEVA